MEGLRRVLSDVFSVKMPECRTIGHPMAPNPDCFTGYTRLFVALGAIFLASYLHYAYFLI